ncbi:MAG: manganese ABC transporter ATP-binding protein [Rhodospirillaceae bacterium]|nr:manganese ABC transporter ATP-binding protein [Rhodospirillaceae bacterium]
MTVNTEPLVGRPAYQAGVAISQTNLPLFVGGLTVAYDRRPVLWNIEYTAPPGGVVGIIGPNGAGKTTFLRAVMGLIPRLSGQIRVFGTDIAQQTKRVAYVPQRTSVDWNFPASTLDVVTMGLYGRIGWFRPVRRKHRASAMEALDRLGLADFADRQIGQLSGGQQQRAFIARALAQQAEIYLLDEPLAGVDAATENRIINILHGLGEAGYTVLAVHHDLSTVRNYFSDVLILNGQVVASGPTGKAFTDLALTKAYGGRLTESAMAISNAAD